MAKHTLVGKASTRQYWLDGKLLDPTISQKVCNHSPNGFNHGYCGSGPSQLALAIMLVIEGKPGRYHDLKLAVISGLPQGKNFKTTFEWPLPGEEL